MTETPVPDAVVQIAEEAIRGRVGWRSAAARVVAALAHAGWLHDPAEVASGAKLTAAEWAAIVSASAQLEVDWYDDGGPEARRRYAELERARAKIRAAMVPPAAR